MNPPPVATREIAREERFNAVWIQELNDVFADVAPYYDRANYIASLGLWGWFLSQFMNTVDIRPGERVLDVCAGTNAIGIALLRREPTLEVHAIDAAPPCRRSAGATPTRWACASAASSTTCTRSPTRTTPSTW
jgi:demethylmenaquinone methyltransferase/2-methoxy-6-polyprenyl-1,4-benzoquinol methylase